MRKFLKWTGIILGVAVLVLFLAGTGLVLSTNARLNKVYTIQVEAVSIPTDAASLERGEHLVSIYCSSCHGENFGGKEFFNDPALAIVDAANLTNGKGGVGNYYTDEDWVRTIRHGVKPDGRSIFVMPSSDFYYFSDNDLGQVIAYLKTLPPVDREATTLQTGLMGKVLTGLGLLGDVFPAENIPHDIRPESVPVSDSAEYGEYLTKTFGCQTCHGENYAGGQSPEPGAPPGPNLTPGGNLANFTDEVFINFIRARQSEFMPFESLGKMNDEELTAIWLYLQSLPESETND
jgi:mono/diheme cytochrome c family protein